MGDQAGCPHTCPLGSRDGLWFGGGPLSCQSPSGAPRPRLVVVIDLGSPAPFPFRFLFLLGFAVPMGSWLGTAPRPPPLPHHEDFAVDGREDGEVGEELEEETDSRTWS